MKKSLSTHEKKIISHSSDIQNICQPLFDMTDINGIAYIHLTFDGKLLYLANDERWLQHFFSDKLYETLAPESIPELFNCKYILSNNESENKIRREAKHFGFYNIFSMITVQDSYFEIFSYTSDCCDPSINNWYVNHIDLLEKHNFYFKQKTLNLRKKSKHQTIKSSLNHKTEDVKLLIDDTQLIEEQYTKIVNFEKIHLDAEFNNDTLSKQEITCIHHLVQGKTTKEIAALTYKSPRTVEYYVDRIKRKLKAHNKSDLITKILASDFGKII